MHSEGQSELRLLLDEHYPAWLAEELTAEGIDTVSVIASRPALRGADDRRVLECAMAEGRIVVTEDVTTFSAAIALVPGHVGVLYCHHARFPRTRPGLNRLRKAISALAADPPPGLGKQPVVWWLASPERLIRPTVGIPGRAHRHRGCAPATLNYPRSQYMPAILLTNESRRFGESEAPKISRRSQMSTADFTEPFSK